MKQIEVTPVNTYSCMVCQKEWTSTPVLEKWWFCEKLCRYKMAYRITKYYYPDWTFDESRELIKQISEWIK